MNTCVCCGKIIPEGRQVCPICEKGPKLRSPNFLRKRFNVPKEIEEHAKKRWRVPDDQI